MRVQITKSTYLGLWYSDRIGEKFLVKDNNTEKYYMLENDIDASIYKSDCIILNEDDHMPRHIREVEDKSKDPSTKRILSTGAQVLISEECDVVKDILLAKNRKYGNSAIEPCRVFSNATQLEQINVRLDDKLSRLMSGQADEDEDIELDLIGYLMLKRIAKRWHEEKRLSND